MKFSIVYKFSLTIILLVLISVGMVAWVFYSKTTELLVNEALEDITVKINNASTRVREHIASQNEDVLFLASMPPIQGILRALSDNNYDYRDKSSYQQWVKRQRLIFITMLKAKPNYLKLRFIDAKGKEIIVVGREGKEIVTIKKDKLQNKSHRRYFKETQKLPKNSVYLSEINLNREHGAVSVPYREVLRSAAPVYSEITGKVAGLLLITADIGNQLRSIQNDIQDIGNNIYITNDHGGYLLHPDRNKTYGFDLGKHYRLQEDIPQLAKLYLPGNKEVESILRPKDIGGEHVINFSKISFDPNKPERFIAVGMTELYKSITAKQSGVLAEVVFTTLMLTLLATLLAILFSFRLSRPIKQMTRAIDDYTHQRGTKAVMPVNHTDEIGVLARSYGSMIDQIEEAQFNLKSLNKGLESRIAERTLDLEMSEKRQRSIVENMADGLITIDEKGLVQSYNSAAVKMFGYQESEVMGHNIKMLMPEPERSQHDGYLQLYNQTGKKNIVGSGSREVKGLRKNGSTFPMDLSVSEISVSGETLFTGVVRDITERKQMDKMKNEFISTVSHELRTPLTSIRGSLGLLIGGAVGELNEPANEMLKIASNNTERLLLLINDILDIQKIESGKMNFTFESVELKPFIEQAITDHAEYGKQHGVTFVIGHMLDNARVFADKDRLMQVMGNLLSNAAKFSHDDDVEISVASHQSDRLRISVTDHGAGIPEEFQPKLFDRFTQSDSSDTRAKGGTGLGLSISKVIIEKHGGLIDFVSKEGIGSTFYIELPELIGEVSSADSAIQFLPDDTSACVLIVEDDPDVAALIRRMLAEAGFNSDIAYDANQARQFLAKRKCYYRLMTLDIMLPGEDGISLLTSLRKDPETKNLPVVVLSVKANEAKRELKGGALDIADWLSKPIDNQRLVDVVSSVVAANQPPRVLHVEDEKDVHTVVKQMLKDHCELLWTTTVAESRELIKQGNIDLVLLDIGLPDGSGLDLIEDIEQLEPQPQVVIFSAFDVPEEYADRVKAVLVKANTKNEKLLNVLLNAMK